MSDETTTTTMSPLRPEDQKSESVDDDDRPTKKPAAINKPKFFRAKKTRVLVLGAGMSGLACARELQQRGYRVLVVEARDRPGGRLKGGVKTNDKEGGNEGMKTLPNSIVSPDSNFDVQAKSNSRSKKAETTTPVDLGGALIHGIDNNPIYALTEQMGIPTQPVSECLLFSQTGWPVDTKEDERIAAIFNECLEETFDRVSKGDGSSMKETGKKETAVGQAIDSISAAEAEEESSMTDRTSEPSLAPGALGTDKPMEETTGFAAQTENEEEIKGASPQQEKLENEKENRDSFPPSLSSDDIHQSEASKDGTKEGARTRCNGKRLITSKSDSSTNVGVPPPSPPSSTKDDKKEAPGASPRRSGRRRLVRSTSDSTAQASLSPTEEEKEKENLVATRQSARIKSIKSKSELAVSEEEKRESRTHTRQHRASTANSRTPTSRKGRAEAEVPVPAVTDAQPADAPEDSTAKMIPTPPSFGDVFDKVCEEKGAPTSYPLFQWHQANLEVSCGASFPDLGYKWNDDEQYGLSGDHVALKTSWKPVMECMAEGIDVLYQNPVKKVVMVVPDPPPAPPPQSEPTATASASLQSPGEQGTASALRTGTTPASLPSSKKKRKRTPTSTTTPAPLPSRKSRRLLGDDPNARRSSRSNKGQKVERFLVNEFSSGSYDGSAGKSSPRKRQQEPEPEDIHTTVQVTLESGVVLEAEAVVCTLPLGILKLQPKPEAEGRKSGNLEEETHEDSWDDSRGAITFYPPLSERKRTAIQQLGCGLLNKCVLSFSHVFWQDTDFLGLAHPANSYLVLNAARFTNKPILTFMYGGEFAEQIESWTDNEIVGDCMEVIRIICGRRDIPNPLDYAVTRWGQERYSRMSFSYVPPGVDGEEEFKAISEAVYDPLEPMKPVIMFAGEHTTPFHPSTMHGAFFSGVREAYRLDLVVEAEANEHIEFDDDHLYQHTFGVRRLFPAARSPVARAPTQAAASITDATNASNTTSGSSTPRRQHRRRGAASVMNLRQRPEAAPQDASEPAVATPRRRRTQPQDEQGRLGQNGSYVPARRGRRSFHSMADETSTNESKKKPPTTDQEEEIQKKQIALLESRTLMRALESYGHNYQYIQSVVLPIFGSGVPPKTVPQLRARCQQMIRSILSSASAAIPKRVLASWVPKEVYVPPAPTPIAPPPPKKKAQRAKTTKTRKPPAARGRSTSSSPKPPVEGTRRSSRQPKQREVLNL